MLLHAPVAESFAVLFEAAGRIGHVAYFDRQLGILETIVRFEGGPSCSLLITLQGRAGGTEAFCTLESIEAMATPPIRPVIDALLAALAGTMPERPGNPERPGDTADPSAPVAGPLAGVVVVDLTRVLAGPYCTMMLSDLGARVIKIERPGTGDDARHIGPFINGVSAYFASLNRGKESIALDLRADQDRARFESLLAEADVVVENFRGGAFERMGYDWDTLHARFPSLIYAAVSGFGHTGPYANRPAYDMVVQAMGGVMSITGQEGGPPTRVGTSVGDILGGLFTATGIVERVVSPGAHGRDHEGRRVDARLPGRLARERDRPLHGDRVVARPARCASPFHRALRRVSRRRWLARDRGRQRCALSPPVRRARLSGPRP